MGKGEETRAAILRHALDLSSEVGLKAVTFGVLAKRSEMSKSGLYAHFDTKEALLVSVLDVAADRFVDVVLAPALKEPRGIPRLKAMFERWLAWERDELKGGCPFVAAAAEFDDRPGLVRDHLVRHLRDMLGSISRAFSIAIEEGHIRDDVDPDQLAFECWGALLAYHQYKRLLDEDEAEERARGALRRLLNSVRV